MIATALVWMSAAWAQQTVCPEGTTTGCDHTTLGDALLAGATDVRLLTGDHTGGAEVTTDGTTISGEPGARLVGTPGGGLPQLRVTAADVTVTDLSLVPIGDATPAAAIEVLGGGLTLERVTVDGTGAGPRTGVQVRDGATLSVVSSTLTGLEQLAVDHDSPGRVDLLDTVFDGNPGGGARLAGTGAYSVSESWFCSNGHTALEILGTCSTCPVSDSVFAGNSAAADAPSALRIVRGYGWFDRLTFTANEVGDGGVVEVEEGQHDLMGFLFAGHDDSPEVRAGPSGGVWVYWKRLASDRAGFELVDLDQVRPGNGVTTRLDAELVPHPERCPSLATLPACDSTENQPLFDDRIGFGSRDGDGDGVAWFCDCDGDDNVVDDDEDCPEDTGTPLSTDTGPTTPPISDTGSPAAPLPRDDGDEAAGCGCDAVSPVPGGLLPLVLLLVRRRS